MTMTMTMTASGVREESVRAEPVEALREHFDRLSANGYGLVATTSSC